MTTGLATSVPPGIVDIGSLTRRLVSLNYGKLAQTLNMHDENAVWFVVQGIICEQMQMHPDEVSRSLSWGELGIS